MVQAFHEKVSQPPGTQANAAIYLLETEIIEWLEKHPDVFDFSTQVLPRFLGRIATWHNYQIHRDIGTISSLQEAQKDPLPASVWDEIDEWQINFQQHPIHQQVFRF